MPSDMAMRPSPSHLLAGFDLRGCPRVGRVLDPRETNRAFEDRFFPGWGNLLSPSLLRLQKGGRSSTLQVVEDQGRPALEWPEIVPCLLGSANPHWGNLSASCEVRCVLPYGRFYDHDEATFDGLGRVGLALRIQDSRRHYFAGFLGTGRLVLAARDDAKWEVLASAPFQVDLRRYHHLAARCEGAELTLFADGKRILRARDGRWPLGSAGLYATTVCRWRRAEIRCSPKERAAIAGRRSSAAAELARARRTVPPPRVALDVPLPCGGATFAGILPGPAPRFLVSWAGKSNGGRHALAAIDPRGRIAWRREFAARGAFLCVAEDLDGDGQPEVVALDGAEMHVLEGATGRARHRAPYPQGSPFIHLRGEKARFDVPKCVKPWRTGGPRKPSRLVLFEFTGAGGHTIWSYDHRLRPRWVHHNFSGKLGHDIARHDVDGDGRDEIVAGYYALDDAGRCIWRIEDQDLIYKQEHTDNLWVGRLGGDDFPKVIAVAGEAGVIWLDARTGKLLKRRQGLGHMQRLAVGHFRHDLPGNQAWVWTDWGSPGIFFLLDASGNILHRCQPDSLSCSGTAVVWWPDGRQLLLMQDTPAVRGLWDAHGHRVVDLSGHFKTLALHVVRFPGSPTDAVLAIEGKRLRVVEPDSRD